AGALHGADSRPDYPVDRPRGVLRALRSRRVRRFVWLQVLLLSARDLSHRGEMPDHRMSLRAADSHDVPGGVRAARSDPAHLPLRAGGVHADCASDPVKTKIPNSKLQITNKSKIRNPNFRTGRFSDWDFGFAWDLEFGAW